MASLSMSMTEHLSYRPTPSLTMEDAGGGPDLVMGELSVRQNLSQSSCNPWIYHLYPYLISFQQWQPQPPNLHCYVDSAFSDSWSSVLHSFPVPEEYLLPTAMARRLPDPSNLGVDPLRWPTDLLFFFFYQAPRDALQLVAANELHKRGWRYNKVRI